MLSGNAKENSQVCIDNCKNKEEFKPYAFVTEDLRCCCPNNLKKVTKIHPGTSTLSEQNVGNGYNTSKY